MSSSTPPLRWPPAPPHARRRRSVPPPEPPRAHRQRRRVHQERLGQVGHHVRRAACTTRQVFDRVCDEHGIEHKHTLPYHPWTNGQAERMNRTVKDAMVKAFHYETTQALRAHVLAFVAAYNFAKHLKALRWRAPFQATCDAWKTDPASFKINPHHLTPGLYTTRVPERGSKRLRHRPARAGPPRRAAGADMAKCAPRASRRRFRP